MFPYQILSVERVLVCRRNSRMWPIYHSSVKIGYILVFFPCSVCALSVSAGKGIGVLSAEKGGKRMENRPFLLSALGRLKVCLYLLSDATHAVIGGLAK